MRLTADQSCLLVIDIQQRLAPATRDPDGVVRNTAILLAAARRLGVPSLTSEQYPRGLGPTLDTVPKADAVVEKISFSCAGEPAWMGRFRAFGRGQAVVCGMEAHVCVLQTVLDLLAQGTRVFVVADAVTSRRDDSKAVALDRMAREGAVIVTTEMVVFEWLARADVPAFRELSALIK